MPKNRSKENGIVTVSGHALYAFTVTPGNAVDSVALNESIAANLGVMADMYGLYRFTRLQIEFPAGVEGGANTAATRRYGLGFTPEVLLTTPTTLGQVSQMPYFVYHSSGAASTGTNTLFSSDRPKINVSRAGLNKTSVKWFRTLGKGTEADWESQGTIVFALDAAAATANVSYWALIRYTCEFTDVLPTAVTRMRLLRDVTCDAVEEAKRKMLAALTPSEPTSADPHYTITDRVAIAGGVGLPARL